MICRPSGHHQHSPVSRAINQAIRGETEAIRRYAGDVTDASVQTYLLSQGIKVNVADLTEQEKRLYRVELIMAQTAVTAGDFANTSDGLANKQRILAAQTEDLSVKMGKLLAPIKEGLLNALGPLLQRLGQWIEKNPALAKSIIVTTGVVAALTLGVGALGIALGIVLSPIGLVVAAVAGLAAGVFFVVKAFQNFTNMIGLTTAKAQAAVVDLSGAFAGFVDPLAWQTPKVAEFSGAVSEVGTAAKDTADKIAALKEEAAGIFGDVDRDEADSKRKLAETIVDQEEKVSGIKSELRKLQRDEDTDDNATRIRQLQKTLEAEEDALRTSNGIKMQLRTEMAEAERRASLTDFERQIEDIELARMNRLQAQVTRLQEIQAEIAAEQAKSNAIAGSFGAAQATMQKAIRKTTEVAVSEADKMKNAFDRAIASMAQLNIGGSSRTSMSVTSKLKYTKVNDAVISPKGDVISTHPDDYLIATKTPETLGQSKGGGGITINISGTFMDDKSAATRLADEIMRKLQQNQRLA